MSRRIRIQLPDEQVHFLDTEGSDARAVVRAAAIEHALRRGPNVGNAQKGPAEDAPPVKTPI